MPRPVDHLVLAVPDLAAAAERYRAMGFTVGTPNRHPWGTENAIVQLDGSFLELVGLGEGFALPAPEDAAAPFARAVAAAVERGGGLTLVAFGSTGADADAAAFRAAGWGRGRRLDFGRSAEGPDGTRRPVRFSLAFAEDPGLPEAGLFTCQSHHPENFWSPAAQRHANGTRRLESVVLASDRPARHGPVMATLCGVAATGPAERPSFETPTGRIDLMGVPEVAARYGGGAVAGRFAAFGVAVASPDAVRSRLNAARLDHAEIAGAIVVPPQALFGVALAFATAPCHSLA